jgi:hypothetical protein
MAAGTRSAPKGRAKSRDGGETGSLTQADQTLIAFFRAANGSTNRVPYEEIVLEAWRAFPESFSLRNHPEHPDASDIHKRLYQTLKPAGYIVSLGNKIFRLTDAGVAHAAALMDQSSPTSHQRTRLSRDEERLLQHSLKSRALEKWELGNSDAIIDYDARLFFQFSTGTSRKDRRLRLKAMQDMITSASNLDHPKADELRQLTDYLHKKFRSLFEEEG